jgi:hypothetical protein
MQEESSLVEKAMSLFPQYRSLDRFAEEQLEELASRKAAAELRVQGQEKIIQDMIEKIGKVSQAEFCEKISQDGHRYQYENAKRLKYGYNENAIKKLADAFSFALNCDDSVSVSTLGSTDSQIFLLQSLLHKENLASAKLENQIQSDYSILKSECKKLEAFENNIADISLLINNSFSEVRRSNEEISQISKQVSGTIFEREKLKLNIISQIGKHLFLK